jgi:TonB family protein
MTLLTSLAAMPGLETLAWTLVHFLWQGALLALAAAAIMRWAARSAHARYVVGVVALAAMLFVPIATFMALDAAAGPAPAAPMAVTDPAVVPAFAEAAATGAAGQAGAITTPLLMPALVVLWMAGVIVLSCRLLGGWILARRVAAAATDPVSRQLEELTAHLAERLHVQRLVRLAESSTVAVPIVVGWLKPIVVIPTATLSHLAPAQVEALLAHELAHVRRHDYLINLLQSAVETLLFYHPAVWWVSRRVRVEREHCCDDLAVTICDRVVYVRALSDLAAMTSHARLALAATDGSLLGRVRRLLASEPDEHQGAGWLTVGLVAILTAALAPAVALGSADPQAATPALPAVAAPVPAPSAPTATPVPVVAPAPQNTPAAVAAPREMEAAQVVERERQRAEAAALREQLEAVAAELSAVRQRRREAEVQQAQQEHQLRIEAAAERVAALEKELAAATRRQEIGVANGETVESVRAMVAEARRELQRAQAGRMWTQLAGELDARRDELQRSHDRLQQRLAAAGESRGEAPAAVVPVTPSSTRETAQTPRVVRIGGDIKPPALLKRVEPVYPPVAKAAKMQGPIYVDAIIGTDGSVRNATVTGGAPFPPLQDAALAAVRQWVYTPTMLNGAPVEVQLSVSVVFKLCCEEETLTHVTDATALIQRGDTLEIVIEGEDQLPRRYRVSADGTIRLPLVGSVGLVDITATQARDWIRKMLTDRQLAQGRAVSVTIHRPQMLR